MSSNAWISHVKTYAAEHNINYSDALKRAKSTYKSISAQDFSLKKLDPVLNREKLNGGIADISFDLKKALIFRNSGYFELIEISLDTGEELDRIRFTHYGRIKAYYNHDASKIAWYNTLETEEDGTADAVVISLYDKRTRKIEWEKEINLVEYPYNLDPRYGEFNRDDNYRIPSDLCFNRNDTQILFVVNMIDENWEQPKQVLFLQLDCRDGTFSGQNIMTKTNNSYGAEENGSHVEYGKNGNFFACVSNEIYKLQISDVDNFSTYQLIHRVGEEFGEYPDDVVNFSVSPDSKKIVWCDYENLYEIDMKTKDIGSVKGLGNFESVSYSHDGQMIATGTENGFIQFWRSGTLSEYTDLRAKPNTLSMKIDRVQFSPDDFKIVATQHGSIFLWSIPEVSFYYRIPLLHLFEKTYDTKKLEEHQFKTMRRLKIKPSAGAGTSAESITRPIAAKSKLKKSSSKRVFKVDSKPIAKKARKSLTCKELRAIAEEKGIIGISKMKKSELIEYLNSLGVIKM